MVYIEYHYVMYMAGIMINKYKIQMDNSSAMNPSCLLIPAHVDSIHQGGKVVPTPVRKTTPASPVRPLTARKSPPAVPPTGVSPMKLKSPDAKKVKVEPTPHGQANAGKPSDAEGLSASRLLKQNCLQVFNGSFKKSCLDLFSVPCFMGKCMLELVGVKDKPVSIPLETSECIYCFSLELLLSPSHALGDMPAV